VMFKVVQAGPSNSPSIDWLPLAPTVLIELCTAETVLARRYSFKAT